MNDWHTRLNSCQFLRRRAHTLTRSGRSARQQAIITLTALAAASPAYITITSPLLLRYRRPRHHHHYSLPIITFTPPNLCTNEQRARPNQPFSLSRRHYLRSVVIGARRINSDNAIKVEFS